MRYRVNIGCGTTPSEGWINFDNTPAIKLAASPWKFQLAKSFRLLDNFQIENVRWNQENEIRFADATRSIPLDDASAECIYTSHMFEHLSREGAQAFLREAHRVLDTGGVLRISVPDLKSAVDEYLAGGDADYFMERILVTAPPIRTLKDKLKLFISGYRHHQWMYDGASLSKLMLSHGFRDVVMQPAGETLIKDVTGLNLHERSDQSVYVEGVK